MQRPRPAPDPSRRGRACSRMQPTAWGMAVALQAKAATLVGRGMGARLWRAYAPLLVLSLGYYLSALLLLRDTRVELSFELIGVFVNLWRFALGLLLIVPVYGYFRLLLTHDGERPILRVLRALRQTPFVEIALLRVLPMAVLLAVVQAGYLAFKRSIPELQPFVWDHAFLGWDRILFLGHDPWVLSHQLLPWPEATRVLGMAYGIWFYVIFFAFALASALRLDSRLRMTFLLAFLVSWSVAGSYLAIVFSSAGPAFFERLFADPTFAPLMQRLAEQHRVIEVLSLAAQDELWQGYADPLHPSMGISAFPSMHLCASALVMLLGFRFHRAIGWLLAGYTAVMLVGSVHLGWHYAVDGIAGIALAVLFWRLAQAFTAWWFEDGG